MQAGSENFWIFLAIGAVIGAVIGTVIGHAKGRPGLGFVLGLLLGWIGWIIVALVPRPSGAVTRPQKSRGWYPDPYRAHEMRYFDGNQWRADVADRGVMSEDPIPEVPPPPPSYVPLNTTAR